MKDICVFGASLIWGSWDYEKGGWVNRLRLFIDETEMDSFVYNLGVPGETSEDLIKRIENESKTRDPYLNIISIGGNDLMYLESKNSLNIDPDKFEKNIKEILRISKKVAEKTIVVGLIDVIESETTPVPWENDMYYFNDNILLFEELWRRVASKANVPYIELVGLLKKSDYIDGLLPNAKGHQKIFEKVKEGLIKNRIFQI